MQKSKREVVRPFCVLPFEFLLSLYLLCGMKLPLQPSLSRSVR